MNQAKDKPVSNSGLLDQTYFLLSKEAFNAFKASLDRPPQENVKLRRLLESTAPWEMQPNLSAAKR